MKGGPKDSRVTLRKTLMDDPFLFKIFFALSRCFPSGVVNFLLYFHSNY